MYSDKILRKILFVASLFTISNETTRWTDKCSFYRFWSTSFFTIKIIIPSTKINKTVTDTVMGQLYSFIVIKNAPRCYLVILYYAYQMRSIEKYFEAT